MLLSEQLKICKLKNLSHSIILYADVDLPEYCFSDIFTHIELNKLNELMHQVIIQQPNITAYYKDDTLIHVEAKCYQNSDTNVYTFYYKGNKK